MARSHPNNWNFDEPMEPETERLNPSVACVESRESEEKHAQAGLTNPFFRANLE